MKREVITIYEIIRDSANNLLWAVPDYQYKCAPHSYCFSFWCPFDDPCVPESIVCICVVCCSRCSCHLIVLVWCQEHLQLVEKEALGRANVPKRHGLGDGARILVFHQQGLHSRECDDEL